MSSNDSSDSRPNPTVEAAAASVAAGRGSIVQLWAFYSVAVFVTILRTYARVKAVGIRNLSADDLFVWIAILFYSAQTALGYSVGNVAHGLANNGMTDDERAALSMDNPEYQMRITGSKLQMAGWSLYAALMCFLKLSVLVFYTRLTEGLGRRYRLQILLGFVLVIGFGIASVAAVLLTCLPLHRNWQIYPDPGNHCQPAISRPIIWTSYAANISTDIYLILIPLPMLWGSSLKLVKKIASTIVLGAGIFVLVCTTLKTIFVIADPVNGAELAEEWGTREAFVAVYTTNLPMIFPLIRGWLSPVFGTVLRSTTQKSYALHEGIRTIGSGGTGHRRRNPREFPGNLFTTSLSPTGSQEQMVHDIPLQSLKVSAEPCTHPDTPNAVYVTNQIEVVHEDVGDHRDDQKKKRHIHETW
ncbi:hypothetical protein ANO14919_115690 [Xylariales sp. No.14919]|nr:hypothetical protein F5X98DRAFT_149262 [Xylaria grammica]GAW22034.1 hypothetical protein ANO14919_115690 [Xylariales sp. No.14919]